MNPVIRAQLREFSKDRSLDLKSEEVQFEIYSIYSILSGLLGENTDAIEVHLEGTEFGIDGVAILIQGELVKNRQDVEDKLSAINAPSIEFIFFQSKTGAKFDYGDISKFFDAVADFFDGSLRGESEEIDDLIGAMDAIYEKGVGKRNPKLSCYFITTGNYEAPARIEKLKIGFKSQREETNIFDNSGVAIEFVGARDLQQWYRAATSAVDVEIEFPRNVVMPTNVHVEEAYIGYVDAENLLKLIVSKDGAGNIIGPNRAVFFDNIRDYDPKSKINTGIKESVRNSGPAEFVFRNNGITVVSKNIDRTGDRFKLEDFQIVNGCQTSNVIFDLVYGEGNPRRGGDEQLQQKLQIPFRLIGSKDDEFVASIILGTNRQNPVRDEQFWALRPFMKSFEEYCRNLEQDDIIYFERRDNQYRDQKIERTRLIQPSALMKAVAACLLFQPQRAARDYRGLVSEYSKTIFLDDHDVRVYHAVAFLYYRIEFLLRNQKVDSKLKTLRYYILAGIGLRVTAGENVFKMKKARIAVVADAMVKLCKDENALVAAVKEIGEIVEGRLAEMGISGQEKIRDTIRSESFSMTFRKRLLENEEHGDAGAAPTSPPKRRGKSSVSKSSRMRSSR